MAVNLIEAAIGRDAFELLCAWVGGGDYSIPSSVDSPQAVELGQRIGPHSAAALIRWGAGGRIYVPYLHTVELRRRRADLIALRERGHTIAEIARAYRYTGRYTERSVIALLSITEINEGEELQADQLSLV